MGTGVTHCCLLARPQKNTNVLNREKTINTIYWGYGSLLFFFVLIVVWLECTRKKQVNFTEYATAGRSYGSVFSTMAFVNTWLSGSVFVIFAGLGARQGVIGFYFVFYSLLAILLMFFLADSVYQWGKKYNLRTQADLIGLRYQSKGVRGLFALIGLISSFPWAILGLQSLSLVFYYLSFDTVSPQTAVYMSIGVLLVRQVWTVRLGAHGIMMSDIMQGLVAYGLGTLILLGMAVWLLGYSEGMRPLHPDLFVLPGPTSEQGSLYFFSIVLTGALGAWSWPDIFVRLYASDSARTIKRSALLTAPIVTVFGLLLIFVGMMGNVLPELTEKNSDAVWFIVTANAGDFVLILAGVCVLAASMGNVAAYLQAIGTQTANDLLLLRQTHRSEDPKVAMFTIAGIALLAGVCAILTAGKQAGLVDWALLAYQGITQLAPTLFLGIFWRQGSRVGAIVGMLSGFVIACSLEYYHAGYIPELFGLTSGVVAMFFNLLFYVLASYLFPNTAEEQGRINELFEGVKTYKGV